MGCASRVAESRQRVREKVWGHTLGERRKQLQHSFAGLDISFRLSIFGQFFSSDCWQSRKCESYVTAVRALAEFFHPLQIICRRFHGSKEARSIEACLFVGK